MSQTLASIFKRMVYSFYCSKSEASFFYEELHFKILERYINIFDEVIFCIIIDDVNDIETIKRIEKKVISIRNKDVIFKIYENTNYRETDVFFNEIFLKMSELNGITFYAHSKGRGVMNNIEEVIGFITASYYFSLEDITDVDKYSFYGSFKMLNNSPIGNIYPKYQWFYVGTFFWGDYQKIYNENKNKFPLYSSRWFNEMLPGNLYSHEECGSFNNEYIDATVKPNDPYELLIRTHGNNEKINDFFSFYYEIVNFLVYEKNFDLSSLCW